MKILFALVITGCWVLITAQAEIDDIPDVVQKTGDLRVSREEQTENEPQNSFSKKNEDDDESTKDNNSRKKDKGDDDDNDDHNSDDDDDDDDKDDREDTEDTENAEDGKDKEDGEDAGDEETDDKDPEGGDPEDVDNDDSVDDDERITSDDNNRDTDHHRNTDDMKKHLDDDRNGMRKYIHHGPAPNNIESEKQNNIRENNNNHHNNNNNHNNHGRPQSTRPTQDNDQAPHSKDGGNRVNGNERGTEAKATLPSTGINEAQSSELKENGDAHMTRTIALVTCGGIILIVTAVILVVLIVKRRKTPILVTQKTDSEANGVMQNHTNNACSDKLHVGLYEKKLSPADTYLEYNDKLNVSDMYFVDNDMNSERGDKASLA